MSRNKGYSESARWRVTHASSIKRIQPDQVARQLRATIVPGDNPRTESALSPLSLSFFAFLPPFFTDNKSTFFSLHSTASGLGGTKELTVSSRNGEKKGSVGG